ncbi:MAG: DMT family transporter [Planctomycetota bacterium]|jgi:drug/metabolite transporter (DMT)-like permease
MNDFDSAARAAMKEQTRGYYCAIVAVLLWSTVASAFKISLRYLSVLPLLFYASVVSTVILFCLLLFLKKLKMLRTLTGRDYLRSALLGFLTPFSYYVFLFTTYSRLPAQEALTLNFTWPIMLVLLSVPLLGQKITLRGILAITVSFIGVVVIGTRGDILEFRFTDVTGVLLGIGSSIIWALFWIYNVRDNRDAVIKLFLNFAFGSCFIFVSMVLLGGVQVPDVNGMLGAVYIGLFEMGITYLVWLKALKLSQTTAHVANLIYLIPFLSIVVIRFVVGEQIFFSTLIGLILIVTGIILQKR